MGVSGDAWTFCLLPIHPPGSRLSAPFYPLPKTPDDAQMQAQIQMLETSMPMFTPEFTPNSRLKRRNLKIWPPSLYCWPRVGLPPPQEEPRGIACLSRPLRPLNALPTVRHLGLASPRMASTDWALCGLLSFWPITLWWLLLAALGIPGTRSFLQDHQAVEAYKSSQGERELQLQSRRRPFVG